VCDNRKCIFTGDKLDIDAVHFVKEMHPFWVCTFALSSVTGSVQLQNLVHITCTRAHLSALSTSQLQRITGLADTSVAAMISLGLRAHYNNSGVIAFSVVRHALPAAG
jgi:hypothetical protein